jgi:hypothetical protein
MPEQQNTLVTVQEILVDTRETLCKLLEGHDHIRIQIKTKFDLMINNLGFLNGKASTSLAPRSPLRPMTEFMGTPIKREAKVTEETLTPDEQRRKEFGEKVDKLEGSFAEMTNEAIMDSYKGDDLPIRGVAKRAGLEKFSRKDVPTISSTFLDDIRTALAAQKVFSQNKLKIGQDIENQDQQ